MCWWAGGGGRSNSVSAAGAWEQLVVPLVVVVLLLLLVIRRMPAILLMPVICLLPILPVLLHTRIIRTPIRLLQQASGHSKKGESFIMPLFTLAQFFYEQGLKRVHRDCGFVVYRYRPCACDVQICC